MKTQQEIEQMKDDIERAIQDTQDQMIEVCTCQYPAPSMEHLADKKRQLMAQYNILLEVLK